MSLILDALRKADAERERGSVPSLHSQPVVTPSVGAASKPKGRPTWVWVTIGAVFGLVVAAILVMVRRDAPAPGTATSNPAAQTGAHEATPTRPAAVRVSPRPAASTDAQSIAEPAPWRQPVERNVPRADEKNDRPVVTLGNVPPAGPAPVYSREQLPPEIRAVLPQFTIGGSVYSPDPTARSLIVNGQLYREKDRLNQELSLEEIKLRAAVFNFRGYRVEVLF